MSGRRNARAGVEPAVRWVPSPGCSLVRDPSLPSYAEYDGTLGRFCDFVGIGTGSTRGNYEAMKRLLNDQMKACAAVKNAAVNSKAVYGSGRLVFDADTEKPQNLAEGGAA